MKSFLIALALFLSTNFGWSQSNVDRLVEELDFLSSCSINNWKYSTSIAGDTTKPAFDDVPFKDRILSVPTKTNSVATVKVLF